MAAVAAAALAGLAIGLALGLLTIKRSGTWCPRCGDLKRCPRRSPSGGGRKPAALVRSTRDRPSGRREMTCNFHGKCLCTAGQTCSGV